MFGVADSTTKMVIIINTAGDDMKLYYQDAEKYLYKIHQAASFEVPFESGLQPGQVVANEFITLECIDDETVLLTIRSGYAYDGASGAVNTKSWIIPSLVHDCLYQLMREGLLDRSLRKSADKAMYYFLKLYMGRGGYFSQKWGNARAKMSYIAVRQFGAKHVLPRKAKVKSIKIYQ